jgi:hypothetical protein
MTISSTLHKREKKKECYEHMWLLIVAVMETMDKWSTTGTGGCKLRRFLHKK